MLCRNRHGSGTQSCSDTKGGYLYYQPGECRLAGYQSDLPFDFDMVVIDELSSFKDNGAQTRFKALRVRPKVKRDGRPTGTPSANGLMDLVGRNRHPIWASALAGT